MKYLLNVVLLLSFCAPAHSQTITPDWFHKFGDETKLNIASNSQTLTIPEEGTDKIWDFSNAISTGSNDNSIFEDPQTFTLIDSFSNANLGRVNQFGNSTRYYFYQIDGNNLFYGGFSTTTNGGSPLLIIFTDPIREMQCPMSFESSFEDTYTYSSYLNGNYIGEQTGSRTTSYVGTGSITTPNGTFEDCIMLKIEDENDLNPTSLSYMFYKDNLSNLIATYVEQGVTADGDIQKRFSYRVGMLNSIKSQNLSTLDAELLLLSGNQLQLSITESISGSIDIYSVAGQKLSTQSVNFDAGKHIIPIKNKGNGIYFAVLTDNKSKKFLSYKFGL